ncbi:MAG: hypothetical protein QE285_18075 [Aquabacterium sp.]|nr:hypothetical protein [Aquabacterium sp.]
MPHPPTLTRRRLLASSLPGGLAAWQPARASNATTTWRVGPGEALTRVADALQQAQDGDTITVLPGTYRADVAVILQKRLHIIGLGTQPVLQADGRHAEGKAIWVVRDGDITVENIGFRGCRVPSGNGAGIRFERGQLQLRRCSFTDNQMGLLTGNHGDARLDIADCQFSQAPDNPGSLPHLLYVGRIARLRLDSSLLQQGRLGHLLKSRARTASITGNRFDDGRTGQASYEIDLPNGGDVLVEGNTLVQSPLTQNPVMLSYGAEGQPWPDSALTLRHNTFINRRTQGGTFVRVWADRLPPGTAVRSAHNQLLGPGDMALGPAGQSVGDRRSALPD